MRHHAPVVASAVVAALGFGGSLRAEEPAMGKDLAATIALQGMPCDKVVSATRRGAERAGGRCAACRRAQWRCSVATRSPVSSMSFFSPQLGVVCGQSCPAFATSVVYLAFTTEDGTPSTW